MKVPLTRFSWADATFVDVDPPWRIVEAGRAGKYNRVRTLTTYTLDPGPGGTTRVELVTETEPATLSDKLGEMLGARAWFRRKNAKALRRLRAILEEGHGAGPRATVAAG